MLENLAKRHSETESLALTRLFTDHDAGRINLNAPDFWHSLRTPWVEPHPSDLQRVLVSFLVQGSPDIENCCLIGGLLDWDIEKGKLQKHPSAELWHLTVALPADIIGSYRVALSDPGKSLLDDSVSWDERRKHCRPDRHNPDCQIYRNDPFSASEPLLSECASVFRGPQAPPELFSELKPDTPQGAITAYHLKSDILGNERPIWIYKPAWEASNPLPLAVVFDGAAYMSTIPTHRFLDHLIAVGTIPPLAAVFVESLEQETRNRELCGNPDFVKFLTKELLPFVGQKITVSEDPCQTLAVGSSYGGLSALYCGITCPERFGLVLAQAASAASSPDANQPIKGKLIRLVEQYAQIQGRYYLDIGSRETYLCTNCDRPATYAHRELVELIKARAPEVYNMEYAGSHDYACWRYSLPVGLAMLFGSPSCSAKRAVKFAPSPPLL